MDAREEFSAGLDRLRSMAKENGNTLSLQDVKDTYKDLGLAGDKMQMVLTFLEEEGIRITDPDTGETSTNEEEREQSLDLYLAELDKISPLDEIQEKKLFDDAASGDDEARGALIERYLPAVFDLAGEIQEREKGKGKDYQPEDLVQEANMALVLAVSELHPEDGDTLAACRVRLLNDVFSRVEHSLEEQESRERSDDRILRRMNRFADAVHTLEAQLERKPSIEEMSAYLEIPEEEIRDLLRVGEERLKIEDV